MSNSIYNVQAWANNTFYRKDDIVSNGDFFYYAIRDHTSHPSLVFTQVLIDNPDLWGGVGVDPVSGESAPLFIWRGSYDTQMTIEPLVKVVKFGGGYEQRIQDGINNILPQMNLIFDNRGADEATAILHFFTERAGVSSFLYTPPPPYNSQGKYVARNWEWSQIFHNNYNITAKFDAVTQ